MHLNARDRKAVVTGSAVISLLVAQQAAARVVRDVLFLSVFPATLLPVAMIAASIGAMASVAFASSRLSRVPPSRLLPWMTLAAGVSFFAVWGLTGVAPRVAAAILYVHFAVFGGVVVSGFWSCVNERFDPLAAKEAMRRIGIAGSCGALAGGAAVSAAVRVVSVDAVLPALAGTSVLISAGLYRFAAGATTRREGLASVDAPTESAVAVLHRVSYLRVLALVVACGAMTDVFIDYVFKSRAAAQIHDPAALASFLGLFNTAVTLVALGIQAGVAGACLKKLGLAGTVALRPAGVLLASGAGLVHPGFGTAAGARAFHDVATASLFRPAYESLFTPLPEQEKRPTKAVVDVAVDKLGSLLGSVAILAVLALAPAQAIGVLQGATLALCVLAVTLTPRLQRGYVTTLERNLLAGVVHLDTDEVVDEDTRSTLARASLGLDAVSLGLGMPVVHADPLVTAVADLRSGEPQRLLRVLAGRDLPAVLVGHVIAVLERDELVRPVVHALRAARPAPVGQLIDVLLDPEAHPVVRARIPRVLRGMPGGRTVEGLLMGLADDRAQVRIQCGRALAVLTRRNPTLVADPHAIMDAIQRELARQDDEVDLEHVFTLLSLMLDREPLQLAFRALRKGDRGERGTALEYLANVLPPRLRGALWPHLLDAKRLGALPAPEPSSSAAVTIDRTALRAQLAQSDPSNDDLRERVL